MKSESIAYGIAGVAFGLIAGWIIGTQQAAPRTAPAPAQAAAAPAQNAPSPRAAILDETRGHGAEIGRRTAAVERAAARRARQPVLRRRAVRRCDHVVPGGAEDHAERREPQHRPGRLLLLHEPGGQGAAAALALAQHRSEAREDAAEHRHRQGVRQAGSRRRDQGVAAGRRSRPRHPRRTGRQACARHAEIGSPGARAHRSREASRVPARAVRHPRDLRRQGVLAAGRRRHRGRCRGGPPDRSREIRGVPMARDPVCGTYVVPDRAVAVVDGRQQVFFCSTACRDKYRMQAG